MTKRAYLSLGSNLGDRLSHLEEALQRLELEPIHILRRSGIYETEPQDIPDQPWFLNLVVEVETALFPRQLLARLQAIEAAMGRRRPVKKGPRVIDVDILLFGRVSMDTPELTIPHARMHERRFVLQPLAELIPGFRHPLLGKSVRELTLEISGQQTRVFSG